MIDIVLMFAVTGTVVLALMVDIAAVAAGPKNLLRLIRFFISRKQK